MFADACEMMKKCTLPVISIEYTVGGTAISAIGSFVIINNEGWAITAAHILKPFKKYSEDHMKIVEVLTHNENNHEKLELNPNWVEDFQFWWGGENIDTEYIELFEDVDIAVIKLSHLEDQGYYPTFKDPDSLRPGTSLCRMGFPFIENIAVLDEETNKMRINDSLLPVPIFPNEGMYTRIVRNDIESEIHRCLLIETSTPGFKGQSGGPIFDKHGFLVGIQTKTHVVDTGIEIMENGNKTLMTGMGIGAQSGTIMDILDYLNVNYKCEDVGYRIED